MEACLLEKEVRKLGAESLTDIPKPLLDRAVNNVMRICRHFPDFPDLNLVINLSGQVYEGKYCNTHILFLSRYYENYPLSYVVRYAEPICFKPKNLRFIRKLLESVDSQHCLVMKVVDDEYYAVGTTSKNIADKLMAPLVSIFGHMKWQAAIKNQNLFKYENGGFSPVNTGKLDPFELSKSLSEAFNGRIEKKAMDTLCEIADILSNMGHGTSIVIFCNRRSYLAEIVRLTHTDSGHGIKLDKEIDFSLLSSREEKETILKQITKIDGGLVFDINGKCGAISCVFDGKVSKKYKHGSGSRGSRYNSMMLYIKTLRAKAFGVVVSDDGSVDLISK